eukprot:CAMPEP_0185002736 /NCGR_PEP_ID=MMETSP1098-20130426/74636_1 /TAXON_ID=89044 /ORGANISM="Spumella elongata, Strain CCAP 955/1" /LENGTH=513 /DNA_ID=CAMNT_0027530273 /DNA_START=36 /DNA_END=1577 /DNA_ORIENTATION=+
MPISACDVLLSLIPVLQVEILARWLSLSDVVKLDSALFSPHYREPFMKLLNEEYCVFQDLDGQHLAWAMWRNVKLSAVDLPHHFANDQRLKLFQQTGKYLRSLITFNVDPESNIVEEILTLCPNLEKLVFPVNDLAEMDICSKLSHLPRLQELDLTRCESLTGEMLANICSHSSLVSVDLTNCMELEDALPVEIVNTNHTIRKLSVLWCGETCFYIPFVQQCKALQTLYISDIRFKDVLVVLAQCPALTTLSATEETEQKNSLSNDELNLLIPLIQNLHVLHLHHWRGYNWQEGQLDRLIKGTPKLQALFIGRLNYSPSEVIAETLQDVHRLTRERTIASDSDLRNGHRHALHILLVEDILSTELLSILKTCPDLVSLTIGKCNKIYAGAQNLLSTIANSSIKILDITHCQHLPSVDVLLLQNLLVLKLSLGVQLTLPDVMQLLQQNVSLKELCLVKCIHLNEGAVFQILKKCPSLEVLKFDNNFDNNNCKDTTRIEERIKKMYPTLKLSLLL